MSNVELFGLLLTVVLTTILATVCPEGLVFFVWAGVGIAIAFASRLLWNLSK